MNAQRAAERIWAWIGSEECEDLVMSDEPDFEYGEPLLTWDEINALVIERIRQIIEEARE